MPQIKKGLRNTGLFICPQMHNRKWMDLGHWDILHEFIKKRSVFASCPYLEGYLLPIFILTRRQCNEVVTCIFKPAHYNFISIHVEIL